MVVNGKKATAELWAEMVELYREHLLHRNRPCTPFSLRAGSQRAEIDLSDGKTALLFIGDIVAGRATDPLRERFVQVYRTIIGPGATNHSIHFEDEESGVPRHELLLESGEEFARFFTEVSKMVA